MGTELVRARGFGLNPSSIGSVETVELACLLRPYQLTASSSACGCAVSILVRWAMVAWKRACLSAFDEERHGMMGGEAG